MKARGLFLSVPESFIIRRGERNVRNFSGKPTAQRKNGTRPLLNWLLQAKKIILQVCVFRPPFGCSYAVRHVEGVVLGSLRQVKAIKGRARP